MGRKGLVRNRILMLMCILAGCSKGPDVGNYCRVEISLTGGEYATKALNPEEDRISDVSILAYDRHGMLEESLWLENYRNDKCFLDLLLGKEYRIFACVNFGYPVEYGSITELENHRFHMAYPDEYHTGIPMTADSGFIRIGKGSGLNLELSRLMAKVSIRMDRRRLSDDVEIKVRSIKVCNCPRSVKAFGQSRVTDPDECFSTGFYRNPEECTPMNEYSEKGISREISVYLFENLQGRFNEKGIGSDDEKVFSPDDPRKDLCSYIEISMDYISSEYKSLDKGLIYRFYLGEDRNSLDVERNCHYRITVCPEDDGLKGDGWRVDKEDLKIICTCIVVHAYDIMFPS